jgi:AcrR family transcriptional regulator
MKKARNRELILTASIELFNRSGVVAISTNHIATHLGISPGNLYFHFRNKEEIVAELFERMCADTYAAWKPPKIEGTRPLAFVESTFSVFWDYRFFHREMYHLRRKDPVLAHNWQAHLRKTMRLLRGAYVYWIKVGDFKKITDPGEMRVIVDTVLIASSWFLQFFESEEKPATRRAVKQGVAHVARILLPYCAGATAHEIRAYLGVAPSTSAASHAGDERARASSDARSAACP